MRQLSLKSNFIAPLFIVLLAISALQSCKVTLVPNYDESIITQIDKSAKAVDKFYLKLLETTTEANNGRAYKNSAETYIDIQVELNALLQKNKVKPLNEHSVAICEKTLNKWIKYKEKHKTDNTLSNGLITIYRKYMSDFFFAMLKAEEGKKLANSSDDE